MGRAPLWNRDFGGPADDCDAFGLQSRGGAPVRRRVPLLSRSQLRGYGYYLYEAAELCGTRQFFSFSLRRNDGPVAFMVSKELLPVLHVRCFRDLSRTGIRSILQTGAWRTSISVESTWPNHR